MSKIRILIDSCVWGGVRFVLCNQGYVAKALLAGTETLEIL
jgi:hypothetical protein